LLELYEGAERLTKRTGASLLPTEGDNPAREQVRVAYQEALWTRHGGEGAEFCYQEQVTDPRADLAEDSALWGVLLRLAHERDEQEEIRGPHSLTKALCDLRLFGARIKPRASGSGHLIAPDYGAEEIGTPEEWRAFVGQYPALTPAAVKALLAEL
ncbi:MAG TPA: hypothetical protein PLG21_20105, partial [Anaerolineae bacterium]|nr:hypothetical protein [Anaerolineae bacterium]